MMPRPISSASARGAATGRDASSTSPETRRAASAALGGGGGVGGAPAASAAGAPGLAGEAGAHRAGRTGESQTARRGLPPPPPGGARGGVLMGRRSRRATGGGLREAPAGTLEPGESREQCAARELREETGFRAGALEPLGWIWTTPGFTDERIWLFLATGLAGGPQALELDELLTLERRPLARAAASAAGGGLLDAQS